VASRVCIGGLDVQDKISELLPLLRLKYKDLDVSFRLDEAETEAQALPAQEPPEPRRRKRTSLSALSEFRRVQLLWTEDWSLRTLF